MHEFGLCEGVIAAVQKRAEGRRVARVRVRVGALLRVGHEAFQQAFAHAAAGTEAQDARLDVVVVAARSRCGTCRHEIESHEIIEVCPSCGGVDLDLTGGEELVLESLEYEAPQGTIT